MPMMLATYIHACMHACMHTCMHACIHAYTHTSIHTCMHAYIHALYHFAQDIRPPSQKRKKSMLKHSFCGHQNGVTCVAISEDSETIASGSHDRSIKLWSIPSGKHVCTFQHHIGDVFCLDFEDQSSLVSAGYDMTIHVWRYVCVCMLCMYGCMGGYDMTIHVWRYVCYVCIYVMCVCVYVCVCICMLCMYIACTKRNLWGIHTYIHACMHAYIHTHV